MILSIQLAASFAVRYARVPRCSSPTTTRGMKPQKIKFSGVLVHARSVDRVRTTERERESVNMRGEDPRSHPDRCNTHSSYTAPYQTHTNAGVVGLSAWVCDLSTLCPRWQKHLSPSQGKAQLLQIAQLGTKYNGYWLLPHNLWSRLLPLNNAEQSTAKGGPPPREKGEGPMKGPNKKHGRIEQGEQHLPH